MKMTLNNKSNKYWERIETSPELIKTTLELAKRDLEVSEKLLQGKSLDWCLSISYNSMLQTGRALMFSKGFRPKGQNKHVAVVKFVEKEFGKQLADTILFIFDKTRKRRHSAVYDQPGTVSLTEAKNTIKIAKEFLEKTEKLLKNF